MRPEYPKRIYIARWNKDWQGWQRLMDLLYESECKRLGLAPEPPAMKQATLL